MKPILMMLLALATTVSAREEPVSFKELLSGKTVPLTLKLKDLNGDWRRVSVGGATEAANPIRAYTALLGLGAGGNSYYTKGDTVTIEGETYFIAYRVQTKLMDYAALMRGGMRPDQMPKPEPPTPDSLLTLSLVHLRDAGSLNDIRPFDLETELTGGDTSPAALEEAREKAAQATGLQNLRAIGVALLAYARDGDKSLPPMQDAAAAKKALQPYTKDDSVFTPPSQPNPSLSGKKLANFPKPEETVAFYENKPTNDTRGVLFLDGHTERIAETKWPALKKISNIP